MSDRARLNQLVFGVATSDPEAAAVQSTRMFVRDQDHLAFHKPTATGHALTAIEALRAFGLEKLYEAFEYGAAVIVGGPAEPGATVRKQREELGLTQEHLARAADVPLSVVEAIERGKARASIHALERIAQALALDERVISWVPRANADPQLAVRLRDYSAGSAGLSPRAVAALSQAAWVARTEARLGTWLRDLKEDWRRFHAVDDFGDWHRPAWRIGYDLASDTRHKLGLEPEIPIDSLRELVSSLGIIVVQDELPKSIAGATVSVDSHRAIVVNVTGANDNPWIRRATMAHELGHLLWDPEPRLNRLKVDTYSDLDRNYSGVLDPVEARANAFAIALLAPPQAVIRVFGDHDDPDEGLRAVMESFGISKTAAKHHIRNAYNNAGMPLRVDVDALRCNSAATQEWVVNENMTLDWFPVQSTPLSRRGSFAARVVQAESRRLISTSTAAGYLATEVETYVANRNALADVLGVTAR